VKKLRQLAKDNAADLPKVSLLDEGLESGTETDGANARAIPLSSHRVVRLQGKHLISGSAFRMGTSGAYQIDIADYEYMTISC